MENTKYIRLKALPMYNRANELIQKHQDRYPNIQKLNKTTEYINICDTLSSNSERIEDALKELSPDSLLKHEINLTNNTSISIIKHLGSGAYSDAYHAKLKINGSIYDIVIKKNKPNCNDNDRSNKNLDNTAQIAGYIKMRIYTLEMKNLMHVYHVGDSCSFSEFCDKDRLSKYIGKIKSTKEKYDIALQIAQWLKTFQTITNNSAAHSDLKPENIFCKSDGDAIIYKIGDYDFACEEVGTSNEERCGTVGYIPPECIDSDHYLDENKSDIWALGAIFHEIFFGRPAFDTADLADYQQMILEHKYISNDNNLCNGINDQESEDMINLINKMLVIDYKDRYTIDEVIQYLHEAIHKLQNAKNTNSMFFQAQIENQNHIGKLQQKNSEEEKVEKVEKNFDFSNNSQLIDDQVVLDLLTKNPDYNDCLENAIATKLQRIASKDNKLEITIGMRLGAGTFGTVYNARFYFNRKGYNFALKELSDKPEHEKHISEEIKNTDLMINKNLQSINVMKIYRRICIKNKNFVISEYCNEKTLEKWIKNNNNLSLDDVIDISLQIAEGIKVLHDNGITHRDIKPDNIIISKHKDEKLIFKLTDFGTVSIDKNMIDRWGTPLYLCPEIVQSKQYDNRCDIWSLGMLIDEIIRGEHFFADTKTQTE